VKSPGIHAIFGLNGQSFSKTYTDFLAGEANVSDIVYDLSDIFGFPEEQLQIVPSAIGLGDIATTLSGKRNYNLLRKAITSLVDSFNPDYIIIDTHPGINEDMLLNATLSDAMITVVRPDNQDYQGAGVSAELSRRLKVNTYLLLNKVHPSLDSAKLSKKLEEIFKLPVAGVLPFAEEIMLAESKFVFAHKYPNHAFSREIGHIARSVFGLRPKEPMQIMYDILKTIEEQGAVPGRNQIQPPAYLSDDDLKKYLQNLHRKKYIQEKTKDGSNHISVTKKGEEFLGSYNVMKDFIESFGI